MCCSLAHVETSCPCCYNHHLDSSAIRPPPPLVLSLLSGVIVYCGMKCGKQVRLDHYDRHLAGNCQGHYIPSVNSPSKMTLKDVLAKPATLPATPAEVRAAEHLVRCILEERSPEEKVVRVPTRGQVSQIHDSTKPSFFCINSPSPWCQSLDAVPLALEQVKGPSSDVLMTSVVYAPSPAEETPQLSSG